MTHMTTNRSFFAAPASPSTHQGGQQFSYPPPLQQAQTSTTSMHSTLHQQTPSTAVQQLVGVPNMDASRGGVNDPTASSSFLRNFNLVAEAAKRAQMAVLMRDMGDMIL